jgi:hypothetical protein
MNYNTQKNKQYLQLARFSVNHNFEVERQCAGRDKTKKIKHTLDVSKGRLLTIYGR